jgi:tRNA G37 N-methylase TrmD
MVTIHIECFVQTNDMTAYRLEMKLDQTVSCRNELVRDTYHAGQTRIESVWCRKLNSYCYNLHRVFRADKINIECCVQKNDMTAYRLEMKLDHTVSCRNDLVRNACHAGQTSRNMNTYHYNTYRVFRADE